jgi:AraC-like DNA-binding protein
MLYRRVTPAPPLSAFVQCLWYSEGFEGVHQQERLLPNGESGIVIDLRAGPMRIRDSDHAGSFDTFSSAIFCGARTDCFIIDTREQERVIGVQFFPGGAFPFLGMPASEVAGATIALDDIWPANGSVSSALLREELLAAPSVSAMFGVLQAALERLLLSQQRKATPSLAIAFAIRNLSRPSAAIRIADVADRVGFSQRRLIDLFRDETGLTPKAFQRVRRFQHVLQSLRGNSDNSGTDRNWAALAADCGYFDQAHFIHDFKSFSGLTPGEYVAVATPHLNHIPLP